MFCNGNKASNKKQARSNTSKQAGQKQAREASTIPSTPSISTRLARTESSTAGWNRMSERRYLERGAVHTKNAPPERKVVPRREDDDALYGTSGRIRRGSSKYIPGSKSWYSGFNVQGQDDPLVETYPVGLRRRRLWCVVGLVVLCGLLSITALIGSIWIINQLNIDSRGMHAMVIDGDTVGFLHEFGADEVFVRGEAEVYIVRGAPENPTIFRSDQVRFRALSQSQSSQSTLDVGGADVHLSSPRLRVTPEDSSTAHFVGDAEQTQFSSEALVIENNITARPQVEATRIEANAGEPLVVTSDRSLTATSFLDTTLSSTHGHVHVRARGPGNNLTFVNTNDIVTAIPFLESSFNAGGDGMFLNLRQLRRPDAVSSGNLTSFTLCNCADNSIYLVQGNATCADTPTQYLSHPCL
ncbi:hypothetical protein PTSG_10962 [Salpingoeca rosetta]|uniref:Beta-sarcoglycan n=1 Tax=Salpingoeca rosetta (strain ATCC 50818 / BSB-021) TaxID=946362 RepID=F2USB0_SALR5|nr:uncharacterized protein PTSG_10962 [Salpingoeca rosetta]EGD81019.1 hypothetical protein PTSG_10962 [Salpingoeca rosetta]|eukprot:XP_004987889.1 hypothetical protein PTSG_10962 [Salpingoeca rosetta]